MVRLLLSGNAHQKHRQQPVENDDFFLDVIAHREAQS